MSDNAQRNQVVKSEAPRAKAAIPLPPRPTPQSSETVRHGTNLTIYYLAIENFLNRYPGLSFIDECVKGLQGKLASLAQQDNTLYSGIKSFVSAMPLDAISQSSHPKKIKQIILESLLNPSLITQQVLQTDPQVTRSATLADFIRDLQYYSRLCDLSSDAMNARNALTQILGATTTLSIEEQVQFRKSAESLSFKYLTDKTFCLSGKVSNIVEHPTAKLSQASPSAPPIATPERHDIALEAILLFRTFESLSRDIVAAAGETFESIQRRAKDQRADFVQFKNECQRIPTSRREEIYSHINHNWKTFLQGDRSYRNRQARFLDFLSNSA